MVGWPTQRRDCGTPLRWRNASYFGPPLQFLSLFVAVSVMMSRLRQAEPHRLHLYVEHPRRLATHFLDALICREMVQLTSNSRLFHYIYDAIKHGIGEFLSLQRPLAFLGREGRPWITHDYLL